MGADNELTDAEAAVYDRQLRVWGVDVQKRLSSARVLIVGMTGLASEVAKNLVLAGIGSLTIMDTATCSGAAPGNFLAPADAPSDQHLAEACAATLQEMNPLVKVAARIADSDALLAPGGFEGFDVAILGGGALKRAVAVDGAARSAGVKLFAARSRGPAAYFLADIGTHAWREKGAQEGEDRQTSHPPLGHALSNPGKAFHRRTHVLVTVLLAAYAFEAKEGREPSAADAPTLAAWAEANGMRFNVEAAGHFLAGAAEFAPINAVAGGVLANEVVRVVSANKAPHFNCCLFSLLDGGKGVFSDLDWQA